MPSAEVTTYLFVINNANCEPSVFLVEQHPGVVGFPVLTFPRRIATDEIELARRVQQATGLSVKIVGFLDPPVDEPLAPPATRFLVARFLDGRPNPVVPHVGWEWKPAADVLSLHFVPRLMVAELRAYVTG